MTGAPPAANSPTRRIVVRGAGLGLVSGAGAGGLLGWMLAQFHPIGLALGAAAGLAYGLVGGLAVGVAVAWAVRSERPTSKPPAAIAATVPSLIALIGVLASTVDAAEWIPFVVVIPAVAAAALAWLQADVIAGIPRDVRLRASQRGLPPGPLAGPWEPDDG